jgi:putative FmdB family regulatory protein
VPVYEYECGKCGHRFELIQKFSDLPVKECPLCKGEVRKVISSPGIMFKGSGWYVTDYSKKLKNPSEDVKASTEKKPSEKKEQIKEGSPPPAPTPPPSDKKSEN